MVEYIVTAIKKGYRQRIGVYTTKAAQQAKIASINKKNKYAKAKGYTR